MQALFNTLPRPTFRWLKVNHTAGEVWPMGQHMAKVVIAGDTSVVEPLTDKALLNPSYEGVAKAKLEALSTGETEGLAIHVKENEKASLLLHFTLNEEAPSAKGRVKLFVEKGATLEILYLCDGEGEAPGVFELFTEGLVQDGGKLTFIKVQLLTEKVQQFEHRYVQVEEEGEADFVSVELGGAENYLNFSTRLVGKASALTHDLAYLGHKEQKFDVAMLMSHEGKQSTCEVRHLGALANKAKKSFRGTLDFLHGSTGAEGAEEDICLLLDPEVKSISLPLLLCKEDDVSGNHAASAGQIDQNKLFYLMSRGFSETEAKHMIVESMLRPVLDKIGNEDIEEKALELLRSKI